MDALRRALVAQKPEISSPLSVRFESSWTPPLALDLSPFNALGIVLPSDMLAMWSFVSSATLFRDVSFGQAGLELFRPDQALETTRLEEETRPAELRPGDLFIARFLGETDQLLVRCNPAESDFGSVLCVPSVYSRDCWLRVAASLEELLTCFADALGEKYWA